jgi:hypothetical protein
VFVSSTQLAFKPYNGNLIKINGVNYTIPNAGIAGLGNTGIFMDGVAGRNLAAGGNYMIFAFVNGGVVTADFTNGQTHTSSATAGNEGVEIKTSDDTRTLIGFAYTNTSAQFVDSPAQRFVLSWFNRRQRHLLNTFTAVRATTSTSPIELNSEIRCEFLLWNDDAPHFTVNAMSYPGAAAGNTTYTTLGFNAGFERSLVANQAETSFQPLKGASVSIAKASLNEGYNFATLIAYVAPASTGTWDARCTLTGSIQG